MKIDLQPIPPKEYLGEEGEDPSVPFYASGNYVGQNWSDGKNQSSVAFGDAPVLNELDELAYYHDTAYAMYHDDAHRRAADELFYEEAMKLKQKYGSKWAEDPQIAARLVLYGNYAKQQISDTARNAKFGMLGLVYQGGKNILEMNKRLNGTYLKTEKNDLQKLYKSKEPNRIAVKPLNPPKKQNFTGVQKAMTNVKNTIAAGNDYLSKLTRSKVKVQPEPVETKEQRSDRLRTSQAQRVQNFNSMHSAALAQQGAHQVYHKPKLNLNAAKPKKKNKKKRTSILPA